MTRPARRRCDPLLDGDVDLAVVLIVLAQGRRHVRRSCSSPCMFMIWFERKVIADMQNRIGPNRAGPVGHPADARRRHQALLQGGPAARPGRPARVPARAVPVVRARVPDVRDRPDRRRLHRRPRRHRHDLRPRHATCSWPTRRSASCSLLAMSSIAVYGVMLAGWSSGSKYPLLGSVRASAQMVSYEAALGPVGRAPSCSSAARCRRTASSTSRRRRGIVPTGTSSRTGVVPFVIFLDRRHGRAQPAAVRPRRGRAGARRRLQHRVQLDPLRPVLPGRVHEHDHDVGDHRHAVPRRPERPAASSAPAGSGRIVWFFAQAARASCSCSSGSGPRCPGFATTS